MAVFPPCRPFLVPPNVPVVHTPPGLDAIYRECRRIYPNQPNPLQVTAMQKLWLGGPDPLDYISMYSNPGAPENNIPPHWHYVSFGLTDLHGDGRVHQMHGGCGPSGFGFELTLRLIRDDNETSPPTWPAALMQQLARYVFSTENELVCGDHVSWNCPLDNSESRLHHMLMMGDPQLSKLSSPLGTIQFIQIIGVCKEELEAAQQWNGPGVLELMKQCPGAGGPWLVTDMRRGETIFELQPHLKEDVENGVAKEGSNLSGVNALCMWSEGFSAEDVPASNSVGLAAVAGEECKTESATAPAASQFWTDRNDEEKLTRLTQAEEEEIRRTLQRGLHDAKRLPEMKSSGSGQNSAANRLMPVCAAVDPSELVRTRLLDGIKIFFNMEAACLLPLALKGRLRHARHFTFKAISGSTAITLVAPGVVGAFVDEQHPYAAHGIWVQALLPDEFVTELLEDLGTLSPSSHQDLILPHTFTWPSRKFSITIFPDNA